MQDRIVSERTTPPIESLTVADLMPQATIQPPEYFTGTKEATANKNISKVITVGKWEVAIGNNLLAIDPSGNTQSLPTEITHGLYIDTRSILEEARSSKDKNFLFLSMMIHPLITPYQ